MLNINPFRNFIKPNLKNFKQSNLSKFVTKYNNLKPLSKDTISFRGSEPLNQPLLDAFPNLPVCKDIYENGKLVEGDLHALLEEMVKPYIYNEETNPEGIVQKIETRVKMPISLREKAAKKLAWAIKNDTTKTFDPESADDIKKNCGDIIGGRIILREPSQDETSKIIDSLIEKVKTKKLKITKIENYISDSSDSEKEYFRKSDLERLKEAVNKTFGIKLKVEENKKATGYMALHLDIDLSNDDYRRKNDNYRGEIQIVGYDVSKLKDIEDLCYKLKGNNKIKGGHPAYKAFSELFETYINAPEIPNNLTQGYETFIKYNKKFINSVKAPDFIKEYFNNYLRHFNQFIKFSEISDEDKQNLETYLENFSDFINSPETPDIKQEFETYTKRAYNLQRLKDPTSIEAEQYAFPTPEECGIKNLPPELDFNNLAKLKDLCDSTYRLMENV